MPSIIDALVVTLGLDGSKFISGQKDAEASMAKTKTAALKQSKELEEANKKFADSFNYIKVQAAELFAVIAGASSIKSFIADVTTATAALGRLSSNINANPQELGAWGLAIERIGGNADEAATDFGNLSDQLFQLKQNGKNIPEALQKMGAEARVPIDYNHGIAGYLRSIGKASAELTRLHGGDRSDSFNFLKQAGIGPGMATVLIDNGAALDKYIGSLKNLAPTDDQIKKFEALQTAFFTLQQTLTALGRDLVSGFAEPMERASTALTDFLTANQNIASSAVFSWLTTLKDDAQKVADVLNKIVEAQNWLAEHSLGKLGGALADKFGPPKTAGSGEATPIPWGAWGSSALKWFGDNFGIKAAGAADFGPGFGQGSHPHPASGLFVQGQQVSRGNPMPVTIVAGTETGSGGGLLGWLFGGGSPTAGGGSTSSQGGGSGSGGIVANAAKKIANWFGGSGGGTAGKGSAGFGLSATDIGLAANKNLSPEERAFLDTIGTGETPRGSYSNKDFDPGGKGGRYQFLESTWRTEATKAGVDPSDFSPAAQDKVAAFYANEIIKRRTGRSLSDLLKSGPEGVQQAISATSPGPQNKGAWNGIYNVDPDKVHHLGAVRLYLDKLKKEQGGSFSLPHRPVSHSPLSTMSALHPVTTSNSSNSMHIDQIHVNAPNATNAHGIADRIHDALRSSAMTTTANFGQA